jgi:hypothetical protein
MNCRIDRFSVIVCSALAALTTTMIVVLVHAGFHATIVA